MSEETTEQSEVEYLSGPAIQQKEETWCKIGPEGKLDHFDWAFVEKTAREFDAAGPVAPKNNAQIICKLAVLIREQAIDDCLNALSKMRGLSPTATVVMLKDPLEQE